MLDAMVLPRFEVRRAGRALAALMRNPDDLPQVFTLIESMSGTAPHRLLYGFRKTEEGRRILEERRDISRVLADREGLRRLPEGSLGRAYLAFVERENISAEGIKSASDVARHAYANEDFEYLNHRMRDTHDLWHAATGYHGDVLGELSLLAFGLAQHWNSAIALIVVAGLIKGFGRSDTSLVWDGYRRGLRAAWMPSQDWESLLALPVDEVRRKLKLGAPPEYRPIRSSELRAEGIV